MTKLLLFDIDGTLISTGGAGGRAMARAFQDVFGFSNGLGSISMAGRTDAWIVAQMAAEHGLQYDADRFRAFHESYVRHLADEVVTAWTAEGRAGRGASAAGHPGVSRQCVPRVADRQLQAGSRDQTRVFRPLAILQQPALLATTRTIATVSCGRRLRTSRRRADPHVRPSEVVIIGDTPLDVAVAVAGGARSLGVATGSYDVETLLREWSGCSAA